MIDDGGGADGRFEEGLSVGAGPQITTTQHKLGRLPR